MSDHLLPNSQEISKKQVDAIQVYPHHPLHSFKNWGSFWKTFHLALKEGNVSFARFQGK